VTLITPLVKILHISLPHAEKRGSIPPRDSTQHYIPFFTSFSRSLFMILNITIYWCPFRFLKRQLVLFYYFYTENSEWKFWMWHFWPRNEFAGPCYFTGHSFLLFSTLLFDVVTIVIWRCHSATPIAGTDGDAMTESRTFVWFIFLFEWWLDMIHQYYYQYGTFEIIWFHFH